MVRLPQYVKKPFYQLLNIHGVNEVRETEIHTAEPLVPTPNVFETERAIVKLKILIKSQQN